MRKIYQEIKEINALDPVQTIDLRLAKLYEEYGELVQAINMIFGRKVTELDTKQIDDLILEEVSDVIQCLFSYMIEDDVEFNDIVDWFLQTSKDVFVPRSIDEEKRNRIIIDVLKSLHINIGHASDLRKNPDVDVFYQVFIDVYCIAYQRGFTFDEINSKITQKNVKWLSLIERRKRDVKVKEIRGRAIETLEVTKGFNPEQRKMFGTLLTTSEELATGIIEITE